MCIQAGCVINGYEKISEILAKIGAEWHCQIHPTYGILKMYKKPRV